MTTIGLVGFGRWGRNIFRDLRSLGVVVHVADSADEARATALAQGAVSACAHAQDRKSTRLNSSHCTPSRMPSSA